jgi:cytochrome c553
MDMNTRKPLRILTLVSLNLAIASTVFAAPKQSQNGPSVQQTMHSLVQPLTELCELSSSALRFSKNQKRVSELLKTFADKTRIIQTQFKSKAGESDFDPTADFQIQILKDTVQRAQVEVKRGNPLYASALTRTLPQACMGCHSRMDLGSQFPMKPKIPQGLTLTEQVSYLSALRHYDAALETIEKSLQNDQILKENRLSWENALNQGMILAIRVKRDPALAHKLIEAALRSKDLPSYLKNRFESWKTSIEAWAKEPSRKIETPKGLLAEGKRLYALALEAQKYPMDRSGWIYLLRSTEVLHRLMRTSGNESFVAEASFLLGTAYEALWGIGDSALHEIYLENCIRKKPHSPIASSCYVRLEDSIMNSFTGTAGTDVPMDLEKKLAELKILAMPTQTTN